jgi:hypothetical protein
MDSTRIKKLGVVKSISAGHTYVVAASRKKTISLA